MLCKKRRKVTKNMLYNTVFFAANIQFCDF